MIDSRMDLSIQTRQLAVIAVYLYFTISKAFYRIMRASRESRKIVEIFGSDDPLLGHQE